MDARLLIYPLAGEQRMLIQAQVWGPEWLSGKADPADQHTPIPYGWFTADQWSVAVQPPQWPADSLRELCRDRGWEVLDDGVKGDDGTVTVHATPLDWRQVLQAAVEHRNLLRQEWERSESAFRAVLAGVPRRKSDEGHIGVGELTEICGYSRWRVYQVQEEVDDPEGQRRKGAQQRAARKRKLNDPANSGD